MRPDRCMTCGSADFGPMLCPGHADGRGGIVDHCRTCCDNGRCGAIEREFDVEDESDREAAETVNHICHV